MNQGSMSNFVKRYVSFPLSGVKLCGNHNKKTNCQTVWDVPLEVFFPFGAAAAEPLEQPEALLPQGMCRAVGAYVQILGSRNILHSSSSMISLSSQTCFCMRSGASFSKSCSISGGTAALLLLASHGWSTICFWQWYDSAASYFRFSTGLQYLAIQISISLVPSLQAKSIPHTCWSKKCNLLLTIRSHMWGELHLSSACMIAQLQ